MTSVFEHTRFKKPDHRNILRVLLALTFSIFLVSCNDTQNDEIESVDPSIRINLLDIEEPHTAYNAEDPLANTLHFGFELRNSIQEDAAQYLSLLTYLGEETGYTFKLHFAARHSSLTEDLGNNVVQLGAIGALGYLKAKSRFGVIPVVRGLSSNDKAEYQSFFVVRPDSAVNTLNDIKNHSLALGNKDSTQGHLIPRIMLYKIGLTLDDLASYQFTGSHYNCLQAVLLKETQVCALQDTLAEQYAEQGLVRIIKKSEYYPSSGIATNKNVPTEIIEKIRHALVRLHPLSEHKDRLYGWEKTEMSHGFITAREEDYTKLYHWALQFGFVTSGSEK
ncbi:MAG: phosphate/phosphite/phosphonate ABC transporter substrate-binding protein [Porticoccaceae bacterium]|nr:phosphate/phosphite/phosphonate ABC transporter substrate-binding protein [Porticoccaceae bacterium]